MLSFFTKHTLGFFNACKVVLRFFPKTLEDLKIEDLESLFGKMAVFCRKCVQKLPNIPFYWRPLRKSAQFGLIYSKNAKNKMSVEIHLATITISSLSFGLKNPRVFWTVDFFRACVFSNMLKKAGLPGPKTC